METEEVKTKVCTRCGCELPITEFYKNNKTKDGLQCECKECHKNLYKYKSQPKLLKTYTNADLAKFTPRQLIEELKARGYTGELKFVQIIKL